MPNTLGLHLRKLRKSKNLTLKQLSEGSHVSIPFLSDIERDVVNPSIKVLQALTKPLKVSLPQLVDYNGELEHILLEENRRLNETLDSIRFLLE